MPVKEILPKLSDVPTTEGRYGAFGGRYVPETLIGALNQLSETYTRVSGDPRRVYPGRAAGAAPGSGPAAAPWL